MVPPYICIFSGANNVALVEVKDRDNDLGGEIHLETHEIFVS